MSISNLLKPNNYHMFAGDIKVSKLQSSGTLELQAGDKTVTLAPNNASGSVDVAGANLKFASLDVSSTSANTVSYLSGQLAGEGLQVSGGQIGVDPGTTVTLLASQTLSNKSFDSAINMNNNQINNVALPSADEDVATKLYVDSTAAGLDMKESVHCAAVVSLELNPTITGTPIVSSTTITATLASSDLLTLDGVDLTSADNGKRVLLPHQTNAVTNGVYTVAISGTTLTLTRAADFVNPHVSNSAYCFVEHGDKYDNSGFAITSPSGEVAVGTDAITFTMFSGTGHINLNAPLSKDHNTVSLDLKPDGGLVVESGELATDLSGSAISGMLPLSKVGTASVSQAEFDHLSGVGSNIQGQLDTKITANSADTLTNKSISGATNTLSSIPESALNAGIAAVKIGNGDVDNTKLSHLSSVSSDVQAQLDTKITANSADTLLNKTISGASNTLTNIGNSSLSAGIDATKIADGSVSNAVFQHLGNIESDIQAQIDGKTDHCTVAAPEPTVTDDSDSGFHKGSFYWSTDSNKLFVAIDVTPGAAQWKEVWKLNYPEVDMPHFLNKTTWPLLTDEGQPGSVWVDTTNKRIYICVGTRDNGASLDYQWNEIIDGGTPQMLVNKNLYLPNIYSGMRVHCALTNASTRPSLRDPHLTGQSWSIRSVSFSGDTADDGFLRLQAGSADTATYIDLSGYSQHADMSSTMVFGTSSVERMRLTAEGHLQMNGGSTITNVPNPLTSGHVANKAYVDGGEYITTQTGLLKVPNGTGWALQVDPSHTLTTDDVQTITQKTIDTDLNTVNNIDNADIKVSAAIDVTKLADGSVENNDFQLLSGIHEGAGTTVLTDRNQVSGITNKHMESSTCLFIDPTDNTKKMGFDVSDIPANTVRYLSVKDGTYELVGDSTTQTLSNKTLDATCSVADTASLPAAVLTDSSSHTLTNKQLSYDQVTGLSAGTGLTYDTGVFAIDSTVTTNAGAQTLSNKTLGSTLDCGNNKLINVSAPTADGDATNKAYVDSVAEGLHVKSSCRVATTEDLGSNSSISGSVSYSTDQITATLLTSGVFTVDSVNLANGERVLVKNQSSALENGIYDVQISGTSLTLSRSDDFKGANVQSGSFTFVAEGSENENRGYALTTDGTITVGTTALAFTQFSGMGHITAGTGLSKTGDTVNMDLKADGGLTIESDQLAVDLAATNVTGQLNATKIGSGLIDNTEFGYLNGLTSGIQSQLDSKITASSADTLTNKSLSVNQVTGLSGGTGIDYSSGEFAIDSTVTTNSGAQTLTNKTLTAPVISQISNTGTLTLPTSTGTLALVADIPTSNSELTNGEGYITASSADTLTNKSLSVDQVTGISASNGVSYAGGAISLDLKAGSGLLITAGELDIDTTNTIATRAYVDSQDHTDTTYSAGDGLGLANTTFSLDLKAGSGLQITAGELDIDTTGTIATRAYVDAQDHTDTTYTAGTGLTLAAEEFSIDSSVATLTGAQTLTNKTIDAANNTIQGLASSDVGLGNVQNLKVKLDATAAPGTSNDTSEGYSVGSRWIDVTNDKEYVCLDNSSGAAVWTETTGGGGGGGSYTAGTGLTLTGSEFSIRRPTNDSVDLCNSLAGTGERNIAIGSNVLSSNASNSFDCVGIGHNALKDTDWGVYSVAVGADSLMYKVSGGNDTALGYAAGKFKQDATNNTNLSQCVSLGYQSRCSDNFQCQLGQSGTTTYHYGLQARSDRRDKRNIRDTVLGLDFISKIRAVDYQWNHRDRYFDEQPDGTLKQVENDGSRGGKRYHHGVIAQEVKAVMDELEVDFAGYQDHTHNGTGTDVLTIGYEEFICPLIKSVQQLSSQVTKLQKESKYLYKKVKDQEYEIANLKKANEAFESASFKNSII